MWRSRVRGQGSQGAPKSWRGAGLQLPAPATLASQPHMQVWRSLISLPQAWARRHHVVR